MGALGFPKIVAGIPGLTAFWIAASSARAPQVLREQQRTAPERKLTPAKEMHASQASFTKLYVVSLVPTRQGSHADTHLEVEPLVSRVQVVDRRTDRESGHDGALGVVLVRYGSTEERDDGVADELLDRAPEGFELGPEAGVVRRQPGSNVLRIHLLGLRGRADDVGEEDRDELSFLDRRSSRCEGSAAGEAEPRRVGVVLATIRTDRHGASVRR